MSHDIDIKLEQQLKAIQSHKMGRKSLRAFKIENSASPAEIRQRLQLTQDAFAALLGVSVKTLRNWEQGQRVPRGPALALLRIIDRHPDVLFN